MDLNVTINIVAMTQFGWVMQYQGPATARSDLHREFRTKAKFKFRCRFTVLEHPPLAPPGLDLPVRTRNI
jgi:hypothetical protein